MAEGYFMGETKVDLSACCGKGVYKRKVLHNTKHSKPVITDKRGNAKLNPTGEEISYCSQCHKRCQVYQSKVRIVKPNRRTTKKSDGPDLFNQEDWK